MLLALDLTPRQATRVLAQALHTQAKLEIEPRNLPDVEPLSGSLVRREGDLLSVELHDQGHDVAIAGLVGAFCEIQAVLSGELYMFTSCIVEVNDAAVPQRLSITVPEAIQVANRRRFVRYVARTSINVELRVGSSGGAHVAQVADIGPDGLSCQVLRRDLDELLLIGDDIRVGFALPGVAEPFDLLVTVCSKRAAGEPSQLLLGLQYNTHDPTTRQSLEKVRAVLLQMGADPAQMGGDA